MQSLIIAVALLVVLSVWGVWESGRKFRREFVRRGKSWDAVCAELKSGQGLLIVDTILGPQRGLGHPVIWWMPMLVAGEEIAPHIESDTGRAMLVRCPRPYRNFEALCSKFGERHVLAHSWDIPQRADISRES